ncbi:hypothetical protein FRX31_006269 [Thalictrum thalictroides]|uniref:Uncharacterized protein n=1 Tax=Thalictrum thalictroides TaxID=46969 RepID=A0A7J6X393_THATH|nr:hypothetical protein FRX31_006269 [Thalictrum thalictroides]
MGFRRSKKPVVPRERIQASPGKTFRSFGARAPTQPLYSHHRPGCRVGVEWDSWGSSGVTIKSKQLTKEFAMRSLGFKR